MIYTLFTLNMVYTLFTHLHDIVSTASTTNPNGHTVNTSRALMNVGRQFPVNSQNSASSIRICSNRMKG